MSLSPSERAALAIRLIESLDEEERSDPAAVEQAWDEEIRRRLADHEAGTAETISAEDVFAGLRNRSGC